MLLRPAIVAGLAAALSLGVADFCVQRVTQRLGWLRALAWTQLLGVGVMAGAAWAIEGAPPLGLSLWAPVLGLGVLNVFGSIALYRAFASGLLSVVSPIASTCGAVTVLIAAMVGRGPNLRLGLAFAVLLFGVLLISSVRDSSSPKLHATQSDAAQGRAGVLWAGASALIFGLVFYLLEAAGAALGSVWAVAVLRFVAAPLLWLGLVIRGNKSGEGIPNARLGGVGRFILIAVVLDGAGLVAFTMGSATGEVSVVATLTSMFSAVTVILAQRYLRERLSRRQWVGVLCTLVGIVGVVWLGG